MAARKRPAVRDSSSPDPPETKARSASVKNNSSNKRAKYVYTDVIIPSSNIAELEPYPRRIK